MDIAAIAQRAAAAKPMPTVTTASPVSGLVAHIDGDFVAYNCAGNDDCDPGQARRNLLSRVQQIKSATGATQVIMHLTDPNSTKGERYLAASVIPYQAQRKSSRKPRNWACLREYMLGYQGEVFTIKNWLTREADDGMAYLAHSVAYAGKLAVIATADKDMRMLPGRHFIWKTRQVVDVPFGAYNIIGPDDKVYGHKWFWLQMLQGDAADNIPGIHGAKLGPKTAEKMLDGTTGNVEAQKIVQGAYDAHYGDEWADRFVEQACLLWLRTDRFASPLNFLSLTPYGDTVTEAARRMFTRIEHARAELEGLKA